MNMRIKMLGLLALLIGSMVYWLTRYDSPSQRLVSMIMITLFAFLLGREQGKKLSGDRAKTTEGGAVGYRP